jgi:hypothetical protein
MAFSDGLRDQLLTGSTLAEIQSRALEEGMLTLRMSGIEKIRSGETTIDEVLRQTSLVSSAGLKATLATTRMPPPPIKAQAPAIPVPAAETADAPNGVREPAAPVPPHRRHETRAMLGELTSQLTLAEAEISALKQRLFEDANPRFVAVQLAHARLEIEELRRCLFELNAYRIACELTRGSRARPTWTVASATVAAVQRHLDRDSS